MRARPSGSRTRRATSPGPRRCRRSSTGSGPPSRRLPPQRRSRIPAMPDEAAATAFIDRYRRTFETFDLDAITACYAFPVLVVSQGDRVTTMSVPAAEAWRPQVERIVGAYRLLGVSGSTISSLQVAPVTPGIAHATVTWSLHTAAGDPVYDFTASYTLADLDDGTRIVAISHDEAPKLLAAVARARGA